MQVKLLKRWHRFEGLPPGTVVDLPEDDAEFYARVGMIEPLEVEQGETVEQTPDAQKPGRRWKK